MTKRFLFVITVVVAAAISAFGQNDALNNDLATSFRNFQITRLGAAQSIAARGMSLTAGDRNFSLSLTPHDLRAGRFYAEDATYAGVRRLERAPVNTFKGRVGGDPDSQVRLTIGEKGIEGYFQTGADRFFIEPAARYSKYAAADEVVVYRAEDVLRDSSFSCPQDLTNELRDAKDYVATNGAVNLAGQKVIEIATEADYDFVQSAGSDAAAANAKVLSILNMVEGLYESELNVTVSVVYQHTWSVPDPLDGTNSSALLNSFQAYWNTNYPQTVVRRDTAHLFTYKTNVRAQGYAFLGVICNNPNFAYGLSGRVYTEWGWEQANFLVTAHEIGHNLGATHSDNNATCANTLMNAQLSGSTAFSFCTASRDEVGSYVSLNGICLTPKASGRFDFDGDGKTDVSIFRPSAGEWWINKSSTSTTIAAQFGAGTDRVSAGDFTGDGKTDIAFFRPSNGYWFVLRSEDSSFYSFPFGATGDVPMPADYDGDGKTDAAVFRPSTGVWYISQSSGAGTAIVQFGVNGDAPVAADYDGDGKADIAIFRPSNGQWWILKSTGASVATTFGNSADRPVPGDYTGDGKADVAIFRPSTGYWFILRSEDSSFFSFPFGNSTDVPSPGDYDGDGKTDAAVFRPSTNTWYVSATTAGTIIQTFGASGDMPLPYSFVP